MTCDRQYLDMDTCQVAHPARLYNSARFFYDLFCKHPINLDCVMVLLYYARGRIIPFAGILGPLHEGGTMNERPAISRRDGAL